MKRALTAAAITAAAALGAPAAASAGYTITKSEAQRFARDAAERRYGDDYGIRSSTTKSSCRPQFRRYNPRYAYHRWACYWAAPDGNGDVAAGRLRITGHSDGSYGHLVLIGILWP
jgi:hypothetical protein